MPLPGTMPSLLSSPRTRCASSATRWGRGWRWASPCAIQRQSASWSWKVARPASRTLASAPSGRPTTTTWPPSSNAKGWFIDRWERHPTLASLRPFAAQLRFERLAHRPAGLASALRHLGAGAQPSYWADLPRLRVPVRLITGANDEKFSALARRMRDLLSHASLIPIPDCGHAPHLERPQAFVEALR